MRNGVSYYRTSQVLTQPLPARGSVNSVAARAQRNVFYVNCLDFKTMAHSKNLFCNLLFIVFFTQSLLQATLHISNHGSTLFERPA